MQRLGAGFRQARQCGPCRGLPRGKPFGAPAGASSYPVGIDAPTSAREKGCSLMGRSIASGDDPKGVQGGERKAPCLHHGQQLCRKNSSLKGLDAPTPARIGTCRPKGRSHFSFGGERKVCKRKPAARRLREKALYCPFLKEGVRNVARSTVGLPT